MSIILASGDKLIISSKPLGVGGEGKVYRVANSGRKNLVAKIYNKYPDEERQSKLKRMVAICDTKLLEVCAWPNELLIDTKTGTICGFTMPEISDSEPFHHYYSPAWRKENQPFSSWENLLKLSANLAAAFSAVHNQGIIIGDVNPNSVRVRSNGRVVLIDADSFQISYQNQIFRCRVGVPSFTAPEVLSANSSFGSVNRELNHDLFGLSLLVFHTLFMGRHPFAGVFSGSGDTQIEAHIKAYRYAYSVDHAQRGLAPPPLSIAPTAVAGTIITDLFQNDFTQRGATNGRTKADEWFTKLTTQRRQLHKCRTNHNHTYDSSLSKCVWCELERKGLILFQSQVTQNPPFPKNTSTNGKSAYDLLPTTNEEVTWHKISTSSIQHYTFPKITAASIAPSRSPLSVEEKNAILTRSKVRLAALLISIVLLIIVQTTAIPFSIIALAFGLIFSPNALNRARLKYKNELTLANSGISDANADLRLLLSSNKLDDIVATAKAAWQSLNSLRNKYDIDLKTELVNFSSQHKDSFLRSRLIADANIAGIGPGRSSTLASYGIETAADLLKNRLHGISGFGPVLIDALISWKKSILISHYTPPDESISQSLSKTILARYLPMRIQAARDLNHSYESFIQCERDLRDRISDCENRIQIGLDQVVSINADIKLISQSASATFGKSHWYLVL